VGSFICACNLGYSGNGLTCTDNNECDLLTHNCDSYTSVCENTLGSFFCSCPLAERAPGFNLTCFDTGCNFRGGWDAQERSCICSYPYVGLCCEGYVDSLGAVTIDQECALRPCSYFNLTISRGQFPPERAVCAEKSNGAGCSPSQKNYLGAVAFCNALGMRLCSTYEINQAGLRPWTKLAQ